MDLKSKKLNLFTQSSTRFYCISVFNVGGCKLSKLLNFQIIFNVRPLSTWQRMKKRVLLKTLPLLSLVLPTGIKYKKHRLAYHLPILHQEKQLQSDSMFFVKSSRITCNLAGKCMIVCYVVKNRLLQFAEAFRSFSMLPSSHSRSPEWYKSYEWYNIT